MTEATPVIIEVIAASLGQGNRRVNK